MKILVLGGGVIGRSVAEALKGEFEVVLIEKDDIRAQSLTEGGFQVVHGDFTYTANLIKAGLNNADVVIITTRDVGSLEKAVYIIRSNGVDVPIIALIPDDMTKEAVEKEIEEIFKEKVTIDYVIQPKKAITRAILEKTEDVGDSLIATQLLKKLEKLKGNDEHLLILTHDSPDPDAISAAVALRTIAQSVGMKVTIAYGGEITHHENRAFVNLLGLDLRRVTKGSYEIRKHSNIALVDCQPNGNLTVLDEQDYKRIKIIIDHHQILQHLRDKLPDDVFIDIRPEVNASASILAEYLKSLHIEPSSGLATALFYGIYTDTKKFSKLGRVDLKAIEFIAGRVDYDLVDKIEHPDISKETASILAKAIMNRKEYGNIIISNVEFINSRDALAEAADFLLRLEGVNTVLVFGIVDDTIEISARTRDVRVNIGAIMKEAFSSIGSGGGHTRMGGARIALGIFNLVNDRKSLLRLVEEAITKKFLEAMNFKAE